MKVSSSQTISGAEVSREKRSEPGAGASSFHKTVGSGTVADSGMRGRGGGRARIAAKRAQAMAHASQMRGNAIAKGGCVHKGGQAQPSSSQNSNNGQLTENATKFLEALAQDPNIDQEKLAQLAQQLQAMSPEQQEQFLQALMSDETQQKQLLAALQKEGATQQEGTVTESAKEFLTALAKHPDIDQQKLAKLAQQLQSLPPQEQDKFVKTMMSDKAQLDQLVGALAKEGTLTTEAKELLNALSQNPDVDKEKLGQLAKQLQSAPPQEQQKFIQAVMSDSEQQKQLVTALQKDGTLTADTKKLLEALAKNENIDREKLTQLAKQLQSLPPVKQNEAVKAIMSSEQEQKKLVAALSKDDAKGSLTEEAKQLVTALAENPNIDREKLQQFAQALASASPEEQQKFLETISKDEEQQKRLVAALSKGGSDGNNLTEESKQLLSALAENPNIDKDKLSQLAKELASLPPEKQREFLESVSKNEDQQKRLVAALQSGTDSKAA